MHDQLCRNYRYYLQHYTFDNHGILRVYCGHCVLGRPKHKKPDAKACEGFVPSPDQEEIFATKEFLTKELLQYVLNMDLLPEITGRR